MKCEAFVTPACGKEHETAVVEITTDVAQNDSEFIMRCHNIFDNGNFELDQDQKIVSKASSVAHADYGMWLYSQANIQ
jgi:hypothetical protein